MIKSNTDSTYCDVSCVFSLKNNKKNSEAYDCKNKLFGRFTYAKGRGNFTKITYQTWLYDKHCQTIINTYSHWNPHSVCCLNLPVNWIAIQSNKYHSLIVKYFCLYWICLYSLYLLQILRIRKRFQEEPAWAFSTKVFEHLE